MLLMDKIKANAWGVAGGITLALDLLATCVILGTMLWKGGSLENQIHVNTVRLDTIESRGSPALVALRDSTSAQLDSMQRQITRQEKMMDIVTQIREQQLKGAEQLTHLNSKLDDLKDTLEEHKRTTAIK
jgi:hypothetical protein